MIGLPLPAPKIVLPLLGYQNIIGYCRIPRRQILRFVEKAQRAAAITAKKPPVALVVEQHKLRPAKAIGLAIGARGKVVAADTIVTGGQSRPGCAVLARRLNRAQIIKLGKSVIAVDEMRAGDA